MEKEIKQMVKELHLLLNMLMALILNTMVNIIIQMNKTMSMNQLTTQYIMNPKNLVRKKSLNNNINIKLNILKPTIKRNILRKYIIQQMENLQFQDLMYIQTENTSLTLKLIKDQKMVK